MLSIKKMGSAGLWAVFSYTVWKPSCKLARPIFEYSNNLKVLVITERRHATGITGGGESCDNSYQTLCRSCALLQWLCITLMMVMTANT